MQRKWTVMVYMAGDTGIVFEGPITGEQLMDRLEGPMREDLEKMRAAGSSEAIAVCVQFDSLVERQAFRWHVPAPDDPDPQPPQPIGEVNTGEPASLSRFVRWAAEGWPADHYALVIWGHGSGWDETRIYDRYPQAQTADQDRADSKDVLTRRGIFGSTVAGIMAIEDTVDRALCYDDSARDFLDNAELQQTLHDAAGFLGKPKIDLLGLDACLMNMLEVAYQIRNEAAYLIGSEAVVPTDLWPWTRILTRLHTSPETAPAELATAIAEEVTAGSGGYRSVDDFTQSVLNLAHVEGVIALVDEWAILILHLYGTDPYVERAIQTAKDNCLRFEIPGQGETDYVDLFDLAGRFVLEWTAYDAEAFMRLPEASGDAPAPDAHLRRVSRRLLQRLQPEADASLVLRNIAAGLNYADTAHGVSIYLPRLDDPWREIREISPQYGNLAFSDTAWPALVCKLYGQELPSAFIAVRDQRRARQPEDIGRGRGK